MSAVDASHRLAAEGKTPYALPMYVDDGGRFVERQPNLVLLYRDGNFRASRVFNDEFDPMGIHEVEDSSDALGIVGTEPRRHPVAIV